MAAGFAIEQSVEGTKAWEAGEFGKHGKVKAPHSSHRERRDDARTQLF